MYLIKTKIDNGYIIKINLKRLDDLAAREIQHEINAILEKEPAVLVLNLEEVDYMASFALSIIVQTNKKMKAANGNLRLCCANDLLLEVLKASKLDQIVDLYESEEKALA